MITHNTYRAQLLIEEPFIFKLKIGIFEEEFKEAKRQLESYLASIHITTIGLITDGDRLKTIRKKIAPNFDCSICQFCF